MTSATRTTRFLIELALVNNHIDPGVERLQVVRFQDARLVALVGQMDRLFVFFVVDLLHVVDIQYESGNSGAPILEAEEIDTWLFGAFL